MLPLRLVLDTNAVVSAVLKPEGLQRTVLLIAVSKPARLYASQAILAEYREVLRRPELRIRKGLQSRLMALIENRAHLVQPVHALRAAKDPDDDMFLECADVARADYLITGNTRHFPGFWKATKIISSREFVTLAAPHLIP